MTGFNGLIKITCRKQVQRCRTSSFSGKYYPDGVEILQETEHELYVRGRAVYLRTCIFISMDRSCHCHRDAATAFRRRCGGGRAGGAAGIRVAPHPAPVMKRAGGWRQQGCLQEENTMEADADPPSEAPEWEHGSGPGDKDASVGSLDTFYTESTRIFAHHWKYFFS